MNGCPEAFRFVSVSFAVGNELDFLDLSVYSVPTSVWFKKLKSEPAILCQDKEFETSLLARTKIVFNKITYRKFNRLQTSIRTMRIKLLLVYQYLPWFRSIWFGHITHRL